MKQYTCLLLLVLWAVGFAEETLTYQEPPDDLRRLLDAPKTAKTKISPGNTWILLLQPAPLPTIRDLIQPELKLAGYRINPNTNGPADPSYSVELTLLETETGMTYPIKGLPRDPVITDVRWNRDETAVSFLLTKEEGIELWLLDVAHKKVKRLTSGIINLAFNHIPCRWTADNNLVCTTVEKSRPEPPERPLIPTGPVVQSSKAEKAPARTYQDLLQNAHDEALFTYYFTSQLVRVNMRGKIRNLGEPQIIRYFDLSPDGNNILVDVIREPFSYLVPANRFPKQTQILDKRGRLLTIVADLPLADKIPIAHGAVRQGRRYIRWRSDQPATLYWPEALDGGDPANEVEYRDAVYMLAAPFTADPTLLVRLNWRQWKLSWHSGDVALVTEGWYSSRQVRVWRLHPDHGETVPQLLFDLNIEDRYNDPGSPEYVLNDLGRWVLAMTEFDELIFYGDGAGPEGDRPFIDFLKLDSGISRRIWQCDDGYFERPVNIVGQDPPQFIIRRESPTEPPNYFLLDTSGGSRRQLTNFEHPFPELALVQKESIQYRRKDGVELTGTLYLPPDYSDKSGPLPMLMWAYPTEFKSASSAGQVQDSPHRFIRPSYYSPAIWALRGYAVLDDPAMPIVGEGDMEPNDTFVEQLVSSALAAVEEVVERGVADPEHIAIGGHSYGAFMTANLMAHCDLFAAGIARTGAYNRTLTPFGFQAEQRSFWDAPETYFKMSPFMFADKINEPLLLIHGQNDSNPGTFPMQSERFFNAIKGNGGTARLVMLPEEGHGYKARESLGHMLWEMDSWLSLHLKADNSEND